MPRSLEALATPRTAAPLRRKSVYPFTALVGQDEMKLALELAAIDPQLGGVLLYGERGTGKSTAVRALREVLPSIEAVLGCSYRCDPRSSSLCNECRERHELVSEIVTRPLVDLPLGVTEDRLLGSIHFERAITEGVRAFDPGILAQANRGILYIDEVNLLEDHLIDLLLDVSQSRENIVEREGLSVKHPADFVLIGSCNPEEGELRPQLVDRFGLAVVLDREDSVEDRMEIVRRRLAFEDDPLGFIEAAQENEEALRTSLSIAQHALTSVRLTDAALRRATRIAQALDLEGHRGELTMTRAARSLAALEMRSEVTSLDVERVAFMSLRHRLPRSASSPELRIEQAIEETA